MNVHAVSSNRSFIETSNNPFVLAQATSNQAAPAVDINKFLARYRNNPQGAADFIKFANPNDPQALKDELIKIAAPEGSDGRKAAAEAILKKLELETKSVPANGVVEFGQ
jgi:hypothetical protein